VKKEKLIHELEEAIKREETATTIFLGHISAFSCRFSLDDSFVKKFKKILKDLIVQNERHKEICIMILNKIKKDKRNVF
jgi:rubrerythrin